MTEVTRAELLAIKDRLKAAEANTYANIGPSPILVAVREAIAIVDKYL